MRRHSRPTVTVTTDEVLAAMDPNGAIIKYGEIVAQIRTTTRKPPELLYRASEKPLRDLQGAGQVELVKGRGGGWRIVQVSK